MTEDEWLSVVGVGWGYARKRGNNKSAQRKFWVWYSCYFLVWLWFHGYIQVKTYQLLYFKYEEFTVCQSHLNKTAKNKNNSHQPSHSIVAISCLCWLRHNFGMEYFLVMNVYFRIPKSFPDIWVLWFKTLSSFNWAYSPWLNPKNDSGSTFAIIWFPIFPRKWVLHSL